MDKDYNPKQASACFKPKQASACFKPTKALLDKGFVNIMAKYFDKEKLTIYKYNYTASISALVTLGLSRASVVKCRASLAEYGSNNLPKGFVIIEETPNYAINKKGVIIKRTSRRISKHYLNDAGYYKVYLDNKYDKFVHVLLAKAFIQNTKEDKVIVNHKDGDKTNFSLSNLEWITSKDNTKHAMDTGLFNPHGSNNGRSKLTNREVVTIFKSNLKTIDLATKYEVSETTIRDIKRGVKYSSLLRERGLI